MSLAQRVSRGAAYAAIRATLAFFRILPTGLGARLASALGGLGYRLFPYERRLALEQIERSLGAEIPPEERRRIVRASFRNLALGFFELAQLDRIARDWGRYVALEGEEAVREALARGKGIVWVTGHVGNWELFAAYFARRGYPINVVAREVYDPRLNVLLTDFRARYGTRTLLRGDLSGMREILRVLKRNEILGLLIDQDTNVPGVFVDFFGRAAYTPSGAAHLALRTGAAVVGGVIHREGPLRHRIRVVPLEVTRSGDEERDVRENTQRFTRFLEEEIRRFPRDWVWFHRRWKRAPPPGAAPGEGVS